MGMAGWNADRRESTLMESAPIGEIRGKKGRAFLWPQEAQDAQEGASNEFRPAAIVKSVILKPAI